MAAERLDKFLDELMVGMPVGDPDYPHLQGIKIHNTHYLGSATREAQIRGVERWRLAARDLEERSRLAEGVLGAVSDVFGQSPEAILNGGRKRELVQARVAVSYLYSTLGDLRVTEIAKRMGGRHHTTIMHHLTRADELMENDPAFLESVLEAEDRLRQQVSAPEFQTR